MLKVRLSFFFTICVTAGPSDSVLIMYVKNKEETTLWIAMLDLEYRITQEKEIKRFQSHVKRVNAILTSSGVLVCHVILLGATSQVLIGQLEFKSEGDE